MSLITKRRLASLATASAIVATMAVAAAARCCPGEHRRRGHAQHQRHQPDERLGARRCGRRRRLGDAHVQQPQGVRELLRVPHRRRSRPVSTTNGGTNYNLAVTDGLYPYQCVNNGTKTVTVEADDYVEVRMVFGAEADERFGWTQFDVPQPKCKPTGFIKDKIDLTAAQIGGTVTGTLDAVGCDIGAFNPTSVTGAEIFGARYYGVFANGGTLDVKNSRISDIGDADPSMYGMQRGIGIFYTGASGTISGNTVSDYQKGGIVARDGGKVTINDNKVTGWGPTAYIAQNGVQVSYGTAATVKGNTISGHDYTPTDWTATGLLIYQAGGVKASANNLFDNEVNQYNGGKGGGNVKP